MITPTFTDVLSLLSGILLLSLSSIGFTALFRLKGLIANSLALVIIGYSSIVILTQILSEIYAVHRTGFLVGQTILLIIGLPWTLKPGLAFLNTLLKKGQMVLGRRRNIHISPELLALGFVFVISMMISALLIITVPPNTPDSLWYHLARVAHWLHNNTLHHFNSLDLQKTTFPINAEIGYLWLIVLWGSDQLTAFVQWFMILFSMMAIIGIARLLQFSKFDSLFAALIWSSFTIVVAQATSTKNDITVAFFAVTSFYFLLIGLRASTKPHQAPFILFGLALGLAIGTKTIAGLMIPTLGLVVGILLIYNWRQYILPVSYAGIWGIVGLMLVSAYNYWLNWFNYQSIFGPPAMFSEHALDGLAISTIWSNIGRIGYDFFNPGGLPDPLVNHIQTWRSSIGEKIFSVLQIQPNPSQLNWRDSLFTFDDPRQLTVAEDTGWYGPLGPLLLLPSTFYYLLMILSIRKNHKNIWKWLTALTVFGYFLAFAILIRWRPYTGRFLLIPITIGAPLMAGFYTWTKQQKFIRWFFIIIAIIVLVWSTTNNYDRPILGSPAIWDVDYYHQRVFRRQFLAPAYQYIDENIPPDASMGISGSGFIARWDYLFFGPTLKRNVVHLETLPSPITIDLFTQNKIDYLLLATDNPNLIQSDAPVWPVMLNPKEKWFLVKKQEAEIFATNNPKLYQDNFGSDYTAYLAIKTYFEHQSSIYILTTDPKIPLYDDDHRFIFSMPKNLDDLKGITHIVLAPWWTEEDYDRLQLSSDEIQVFLTEEKFVSKQFEIEGYQVFQIDSGLFESLLENRP